MKSFLALLTLSLSVQAVDWPQYRGPLSDGTTPDKVATNWGGAPKVLWKVPGGTGFSSFVTAGGRCFVIEGRDGSNEVLVAREVATGKELWTANLGPAKYQGGGNDGTGDNKGGDGPRSSPAIAGNVVVAMHSDLVLSGYDLTTGK